MQSLYYWRDLQNEQEKPAILPWKDMDFEPHWQNFPNTMIYKKLLEREDIENAITSFRIPK